MMHRQLTKLMISLTASGVVALATGVGAAHAVVPHPSHCIEHMSGEPNGTLTVDSTPPPGSEVPAGSGIEVTATWDRSDWYRVEKILVCVTVDGVRDPELGGGQRPLDNVGSFVWNVPVPVDMAAGREICVRDVLMGTSLVDTPEQRSNFVCFRSGPAATPAPDPAEPETESSAPDVVVSSVIQGDNDVYREPVPPAQPEVAPVVDKATVDVEAATSQTPASAQLPRTGTATAGLVRVAVGALALGVLALLFGSRRPQPSGSPR